VVDGVSARRIACVWVPFFAAAAAERCDPTLAERPLGITRGAPPTARVVEANAMARESGVAQGMTETEARARCPHLVSRPFSEEQVRAAEHALLESALAVSPRLEDAAPGLVYVDVAGLGRLIGDDATVGERLVRHARAVGLSARIGIAASRTVARVAALTTTTRISVVPAAGERAALAGAPLALLDLPADLESLLTRWGVRTLGELANLPRAGLAERLGPAGLRAHDLALGRDPDPFRPWTPPPFWEESQSFDWEIDDLERLGVVLSQLLERLAGRLIVAHAWVDGLDLHLQLTRGRYERTIAMAHPTCESAALKALVGHELAARPPAAAVIAVAVSARVVRVAPSQGRLGQPPAPRQRDLAALMTRLIGLVGPDHLGSPQLADTHRPDSVALVPFAPPEDGDDRPALEPAGQPRLVIRRLRPAPRVDVHARGERPVHVRWQETVCRVVGSAGPWRASGEWWDTRAWARDEWDLLLEDGTLCRLARDGLTGQWTMDGIYD
jgi:protein ImuB